MAKQTVTSMDDRQAVSDVGLKELAAIATRNGRAILLVSAVATIAAAAILATVAPRYRAEALILIEPGGSRVVGTESLVPGLSAEPEAIQSEIEILKSRQLAREVILELSLDGLEEFGGDRKFTGTGRKLRRLSQDSEASQLPAALQSSDRQTEATRSGSDYKRPPEGSLTPVQGLILGRSFTMDHLLGSSAPDSVRPDEIKKASGTKQGTADLSVDVIDRFLENLSVEVRPQTRVVAISFYATDPDLAALIANTLANRYLSNQRQEKATAISEAVVWLDQQADALRKAVNQSERAVQQYRKESGLVEGRGATLANEEISALNVELVRTRAELARLNARFQQVGTLTSSPEDIAALSEVLGSSLIQRLRGQQVELEGQIAEAATDLGELHPRLIRLRAEAREVGAKIEQEIGKIVAGLNQEVQISRARERTLIARLDEAKERVASVNEAEIQLRALDRDASSNRRQLETALAQLIETSVQRDAQRQRPDARLISRADVPIDPSYPLKKTILALVFLTTIIIGFMVALTREILDRTFRGGEQVEELTGLVSLGIIPEVGKLKHAGSPADHMLASPRSAYSESLRTLKVSLKLASKKQPRTILISSAQPGESKTSMVVSLARAYALTEIKVIIVDCDLRRPGIHQLMATSAQPGLSEVLTESCALDEVIRKDPNSGASFISAGIATDDPSRLIGSEAFRELLSQLSSEYDVVLIDSAPVLASADALVLAQMVDYVLFLISWGLTTQRIAQSAIRKLQSAGAKDMGALLTKVNLRQFANYGFGESGSYTGRLSEYYSE